MWDHETIMMIVQGVGETLYMTVLSTVLGYLFGLPMGVLLAVSDKEGLKPNAVLYKILDAIANIVRSIPFLILLILLIPFTRAVVGKSYGSTATVVPLVVAAIPFIARMVESSIKEVDAGVIEAARAMGASNMRIIVKVLLVEARTSLITGATIAIGTILGYSAMSGAVDFESGNIEFVVVGMGLNLYLDQENLPQKLRSIAGALYETKEDAEQTDRNKLTAMIVNELRKETADLKLSPDYVTHNMIPGHQITITDGNSSRQAFALEICRDGRLKVREEDGQETILSFGEVSVSM